MTVHSLP
ncbi:hypothetical protein IEO21_09536 [Rhodonia placenta]|nr:hypothetical protein IEO21_09536 [Postia placenta]